MNRLAKHRCITRSYLFPLLLFLSLTVLPSGSAMGQTVVNVDVEAGEPGDTNHVGDDGVLSNTGGTVWNSVVYSAANTSGLLDENGVATAVDLTINYAGRWTGLDVPNNLQDSGAGGGIFQILHLLQGEPYTLAIYPGTYSSYYVIKHAGGEVHHMFTGGYHTYNLPGEEGKDFCQFQDLVPFKTGGGDFAIEDKRSPCLCRGCREAETPHPWHDVQNPCHMLR